MASRGSYPLRNKSGPADSIILKGTLRPRRFGLELTVPFEGSALVGRFNSSPLCGRLEGRSILLSLTPGRWRRQRQTCNSVSCYARCRWRCILGGVDYSPWLSSLHRLEPRGGSYNYAVRGTAGWVICASDGRWQFSGSFAP